MSLNMSGHIDGVFQSSIGTRSTETGGGYVGGRWQNGSLVTTNHNVTVQPLNDAEIDMLQLGADRIKDMRKIYVNDGDLYSITDQEKWTFDNIAGTFKVVMLDNRPWRNYCKVIISKEDGS